METTSTTDDGRQVAVAATARLEGFCLPAAGNAATAASVAVPAEESPAAKQGGRP